MSLSLVSPDGNEAATTAPDDESLLSPAMMARLMRLSLLGRRLPEARKRGRRRTRRVGSGTEAIDSRPYAAGDDPRRINWAAYARFERLLVRVVADDAPLRLALVVDTSASMAYGAPSKLRQASRIAAGLAAIALSAEDRVAAVASSGGETMASVRSRGGRDGLARLVHVLDQLACSGTTDIAAAAVEATATLGGRGLCVIISDLLDPAGPLAGARALRQQGHRVALCEVLTPDEIDPPDLSGCELEDEETGELLELPATGAKTLYLEALAAHREAVRAGAAELDAATLAARTDEAFEDIVLAALSAGLLRSGSQS